MSYFQFFYSELCRGVPIELLGALMGCHSFTKGFREGYGDFILNLRGFGDHVKAHSGGVLSPCDRYRKLLWHNVGGGGVTVFLGRKCHPEASGNRVIYGLVIGISVTVF